MKTHTAPPGYHHNYAAILDLIRFGPGIWSCTQMLALLFHAERSTAYGKESDKHDEEQAMDGIYSVQQFAWVRGPAGLSRASWYRANTELEVDADDPKTKPLGVLHKSRVPGRYAVTDYRIDWRLVKAAIARWRETQGSQRETPRGAKKQGNAKFEGSQFETPQTAIEGSQPETEGSQRETPASTDSKGQTEIEGSQRETHSQSLDFKSDSYSRSDAFSRQAIFDAVEAASGDRPRTDGLINKIIEVGQKLDLPQECVVRWIHDFCFERRSSGYRVEAGLLGVSIGKSIIPWMKKLSNQHFIQDCRKRAELARNRAADVSQMQNPQSQQPLIEEPKPDPQFGVDLVREVEKRRAKGAR